MVIRNLLHTYRNDLATQRPDIATWRFARVLARFPLPNGMKSLLDSPSAIAHQKLIGKNDPFFMLANRHYLCRGLSKNERVEIARYSYSLIDQVLVPASDGVFIEFRGPAMAVTIDRLPVRDQVTARQRQSV